jgi:hypothetical protein
MAANLHDSGRRKPHPKISILQNLNQKILMRKFCLAVSLLLSQSGWIMAQITLQPQDLPLAGDTLRYSIAQFPVATMPGASGENKTWTFGQLSTTSQYVDRFSAVNGTNIIFSLYFGLPGNNFSNLAKTENNGPALPPQTGIQFGDVYNFYRSSANSLVQKGFGASLNGIPIPVPYNAQEIVYALPLQYNHRDTSVYAFEVSLPGLGYYGRNARRINHVDGWGKLTTDFGTFDALRIRSVLEATDSIALDTLGQGIRIPLPDEIKYKWVAKNHGWPLLEITATDLFGLEVSNRVVYRDFKLNDTGIEDPQLASIAANIYPNPASTLIMAETELLKTTNLVYELLGTDGRLFKRITRDNVAPGKVLEIIPLASLQLSSGLYFLKISTDSGAFAVRPCIVDNP